ncbi:MAG TPA: hypothetical protein VLA49_20475 [Anaerolineales bacterium]|nr:hypothetical protein [Anaerolineales bacterium]
MDHQSAPSITSFIIRFVFAESSVSGEPASKLKPLYRGAIRHIQSDREIAFVEWREAFNFMRDFIPLDIEA